MYHPESYHCPRSVAVGFAREQVHYFACIAFLGSVRLVLCTPDQQIVVFLVVPGEDFVELVAK